jgi:hypothetical protein
MSETFVWVAIGIAALLSIAAMTLSVLALWKSQSERMYRVYSKNTVQIREDEEKNEQV